VRTLPPLEPVRCGIARLLLVAAIALLPGQARAERTDGAARPSPSAKTDHVHVHLERGDTLVGVLGKHGVDVTEAHVWATAAGDAFNLRHMRPGQGLSMRFKALSRQLTEIRYEIDARSLLVVERTSGGLVGRRETLPYVTETRGVGGEITRDLWQDVVDAGAPPEIAAQLVDILGWDIDFSRLQPGDEFRVLYENLWIVGAKEGMAGKVVAAQFVSGGHEVTAVLFEDADGRGGYYRPDGPAVGRHFLRYPLEFSRISSTFTHRRFHPVLRRYRPHLGIDFAAPRGTPVRATADGRVTTAGWLSGLGRTVRIDHRDGLRSTYGHLNGIASRIRPGTAVKRGQVIGYVGSTGLATGPHLHYAMQRKGTYVDPLSLRGMSATPVATMSRRAFMRVRDTVSVQLARLDLGTTMPVVESMRMPSE
jgi:murein DD-endopeptidase MepM/ murein hydrolase activator NlpD